MADDPDFDADTWLAIRDHAQAKAKEKGADLKGTRRDMLKAGGALGVGALLGGGGYAASTQNAKADASTSDSDGNVGTPSNLVDVFAEGIAGGGNQIDVGDSLVPDTDASYDLGTSSNTWNNGHFGSVSTGDLDVEGSDLVTAGDFVGIGPSASLGTESFSTTSTSYVFPAEGRLHIRWDTWPAATLAVVDTFRFESSAGDYRLQNNFDAETVHELTNISGGTENEAGPTDYTPTTTDSVIRLIPQIRTDDGATQSRIDTWQTNLGVQL